MEIHSLLNLALPIKLKKSMSVCIIHENVMYLKYKVHGALDRPSSILISNTL